MTQALQDPERALKDQFIMSEGVIYLDGNSLGPMPKSSAAQVLEALNREGGQGLIRAGDTQGEGHLRRILEVALFPEIWKLRTNL